MNLIRTACLGVALLLGGCAIGNTVDYRADQPYVSATSDKDVVVAVLDQRSYVLDGDKDPDFVGLRRGGFGNPFDITTRSGAPFADEVAATIVDALATAGVSARTVTVPASGDPRSAIDAAIAAGGDRAFVLLIGEWKTDQYFTMEVHFDLAALVFDPSGNQLARDEVDGSNTLGAPTFESELSAAASAALKAKLERLLNDPEIVAALE